MRYSLLFHTCAYHSVPTVPHVYWSPFNLSKEARVREANWLSVGWYPLITCGYLWLATLRCGTYGIPLGWYPLDLPTGATHGTYHWYWSAYEADLKRFKGILHLLIAWKVKKFNIFVKKFNIFGQKISHFL